MMRNKKQKSRNFEEQIFLDILIFNNRKKHVLSLINKLIILVEIFLVKKLKQHIHM